jgi:cytosine/adenosine deaminase-related metal-dependent hydrolase
VRIGAAVHSVRAVEPAEMAAVARWAANGAALHAHLSEQPAENASCIQRWGRTPTEVMADAGVLAVPGGFTAVHATHLRDRDIGLLGEHHCTCCFCPTTERDLADGIGPSVRLRRSGAHLSIGSDSNAFVDPFEELRAVELDERLDSGNRGNHPIATLFADGCESGHASLGWPDGGRLAPGGLADLVTVGLGSVRLAGTRADHALDAVLFAAAPPDIRHVVVGGRVVVRDGAHVHLDVAVELRRALDELEEVAPAG